MTVILGITHVASFIGDHKKKQLKLYIECLKII